MKEVFTDISFIPDYFGHKPEFFGWAIAVFENNKLLSLKIGSEKTNILTAPTTHEMERFAVQKARQLYPNFLIISDYEFSGADQTLKGKEKDKEFKHLVVHYTSRLALRKVLLPIYKVGITKIKREVRRIKWHFMNFRGQKFYYHRIKPTKKDFITIK